MTASGPAGAVVGGLPAIFLPTTIGVEASACGPVAAAQQTTCTGTTVGILRLGATVTVRFPLAGGTTGDVTGSVSGPGPLPVPTPLAAPGSPAVVLPLVPPPRPLLLPPLPPAPGGPLPMPPLATAVGAVPLQPGVPVIPEATSLVLLGSGLVGLGALECYRRRRQRDG